MPPGHPDPGHLPVRQSSWFFLNKTVFKAPHCFRWLDSYNLATPKSEAQHFRLIYQIGPKVTIPSGRSVVKNASVFKDTQGNLTGAVETITDITHLIEKEIQIETFRRELKAEDWFHGIIDASVPIQRLFDMITNAAESDAPVIILGESGTGKKRVAKAIHDCSSRNPNPYIKVKPYRCIKNMSY